MPRQAGDGPAAVADGTRMAGRRYLRAVSENSGKGVSAGRAAAAEQQAEWTGPVRVSTTPLAGTRTARSAAPAAGVKSLPVSMTLPRMPFVLLVLALLGGGLICLLVVNTTLGATSFRISQLQSDNASLSLKEQSLQRQIQNEEGPGEIAKRAYQLGMRPETNVSILDLRTHRYYELPGAAGATGQESSTVQDTGAEAMGARATGAQATGARPTGARVTRAQARRRAARRLGARRRGTGIKPVPAR